ncbi:DUF2207 domain-containing protein [Streptococcus thermophilus]
MTLGYADPVPTFDKTGLGEESRHLKFKNMVQAIILDLIDRGYIAYSQENGVDTLRRISKEGLADYGFDFLEMLFDDRIEITDREMFSRYYLDEKGLRKQFNKTLSLIMKEILFVKKDSVSVGSLLKMEEVLLKV